MPLFYEADDNRKKDVEFDLLKHDKDSKIKDVTNSDPNVQAAQGNAKLITTSIGVDINDNKLQTRVEPFDEEAQYSSKDRYPVYIIVMHSGTVLANVIKKVTGDEFSHACISFNSKLNPMYSFGLKEFGKKELGLVKQSATSEFYKHHKSHYKVYVTFVNKKMYQQMKDRLQWFNDNDKKLSYDLFGLVKKLFNKDTENHTYKYFCSRFVAEILGKGGLELNKVASLYTPQDLVGLDFISLVNAGEDFFKYNAKATEDNLRKIKNKIFDSLTFSESYDPYEVYHAYRLEKEYKEPKYCCWDEEMYYPDMKTALGHIYAEGIDSGDYHVYTDLGCGKCKYIGKIKYYSKDKEINYTWIEKINQIKNLTESNSANTAMVPSAGVYIYNCMRKNTFVETPDEETEYIVSRDGMSDIFRFGKHGEKIKLDREVFKEEYKIIETYRYTDTVSPLKYFKGILESNNGYDFYLNLIGHNKPKKDISMDARFESVPSFFDEIDMIQNSIIREYYMIRNNKSIIDLVDRNIHCLIESPHHQEVNVSVNEWSESSYLNALVDRLITLKNIIPNIY